MANPFIQVQSFFFDKSLVLSREAPARVRALSRLGAYVWKAARSSMKVAPPFPVAGKKRRKNARSTYSKPGSPPYRRVGYLYQFLYFTYDPVSRSVVIGPTKYKKGVVPGLMEYGGVVSKFGKRIRYAPRPYMTPALAASLPRIPQEFKDMF